MRTYIGKDKDGNEVWAEDPEATRWIDNLTRQWWTPSPLDGSLDDLRPGPVPWHEVGHTCERETLDGADRCPHLSHLSQKNGSAP